MEAHDAHGRVHDPDLPPGQQVSADMVRAIVDANAYMTLATADAEGQARATTVWFAPVGYREFLWVSDPEATHSRNIGVRPDVSIVIFDSRQPIGRGEGVYLDARAELVADAELDAAMAAFSERATAQGGRVWTRADVAAPARRRLYRAVVSLHYVNDERDRRRLVEM
jgi:pyridoxine/pyridoxamine 5'-phosphate oxidase